MIEPRLHATPASAVRERVREKVFIVGDTLWIERPDAMDALFDHPAVRAAYAADEYIPYWTDIWPASRMLAKWLYKQQPAPRGTRILELACGLGVAGIAALKQGYQVTFSDIDQLAVDFACENARLNGFQTPQHFDAKALDLRAVCSEDLEGYDRLMGTDLMYDPGLVEALVDLLRTMPI